MIKTFKNLLKDRRGNALVMGAAALPVLIGFSGLATDTIQWTMWKRQLQRAADSAAIAAVYERESNSGSTATVPSTVNQDLDVNLHTVMDLKSGYPQLSYPANSGSVTNQVRVTLAVQQRLPFSSLFMNSPPTIVANSTAGTISGGDACVQALETNASKTGITLTGNTSVYLPDCVMHSNSPSSNAASAGGSSQVTALAIAAVGGIQQSNNWQVQSYRPYSPALPDPFANVTPTPSEMKCTSAALTHSTNFSSLPAGTNCFSSLSVGSNRTLNIPSNFGPIFINGGSVDLKGAFNCNGCTIVLTNSSTGPTAAIGTISSNAQATNNITAPTTGKYKGIAVYQDRRAPDCNGCNKINGGSTSLITGALYLPSQELVYNGNGTTNPMCLMMVARRLTFSGNSTISTKFKKLSDCAAEGLPAAAAIKMVRLVA